MSGGLAVVVVAVMAVITYACRVTYFLPKQPPRIRTENPFLEIFPIALFVALATVGLAAPEGRLAVTPFLGGAAGGLLGGFIKRGSVIVVVLAGIAGYWLARLATGGTN